MTTRRLRLPERLVTFVSQSRPYADWEAGRGCLPTDRALFAEIHSAQLHERIRKDGSLHIDAGPALVETVNQWAHELTYARGTDLADTRANVRSGRSVIRQINPREFV